MLRLEFLFGLCWFPDDRPARHLLLEGRPDAVRRAVLNVSLRGSLQYQTNFGCGKNMLINPDSKIVNTRGCGPLMKYWYRRGFWENIFMGLFGVFMGVYMIFVFQRNRREYTQLRDDAEDRKRIVHSHSMASLRSMNNNTTNGGGSNAKKPSTKSGYSYTGMKSSPSNGNGSSRYDSDDNSSGVLYQPRATLNPNA